MKDTCITFSNLLKEEFPPFFLKALRNVAEDAYKKASDNSKHDQAELRLESLTDQQGLCLQDAVFQLAKSFPQQNITPSMVSNAKKRAHLEITTNRTLVTSHRVSKRSQCPPPARYRTSNASINCLLLPGFEEPLAPVDAMCNLYILHGPSPLDATKLGFLQIAIPESRQRKFMGVHDLYVAEECAPAHMEEITDNVVIRLKPSVRKENLETGS